MKKINSNNINYTDNIYYICRTILIIGLPLTIISGLVLSHLSIHSSATSSGTDNLTISIYTACTLSSTVNNEHNSVVDVGTYKTNIGKTTITTLCNDGNGYSIYANGFSNDEEGNNKLINSAYPQYSIDTGLATSGFTSTWAMKLNNIENDPSPTPPVITSAYDNTYGLVPNEWAKVAGRTSGTTDMDEGSSFTTTYAVYASSNQHAGSYVGQVKYLLTHPSTKPVYYFMQDVATWKDTELSNVGDSLQAIDNRDGKKYWVARLADGNIWMTENLDLCIGCTGTSALTSENTDISTTASGSGIYSSGYTESNGVWTWTPVNTAITSNRAISNNTISPAFGTDAKGNTEPYSAEGGDTYFYTSGNDTADTRYTSLTQCIQIGEHTEAECKRYFAGNYYNWTAAIASNNSANIGSKSGDIAGNSICPKGWRLPNSFPSDTVYNEFGRLFYRAEITTSASNSINSVSYLDGIAGFNKLRSDPYFFVRSGNIDGGTLSDFGVYGYYWSSTVNNSASAYRLGFNSSGLWPANFYGYRYNGRSIRCLARTED